MRKRNCRVEVCFTKDELSVLSKKAKKAGMSIGGFVRRSVADKEIKEIDKGVKERVSECEKFADESEYPDKNALYDMVYEQKDYPFISHKVE